MARRVQKYDRQPYPSLIPIQSRRYRKAYYFVERLAQIDPVFKQKFGQIANQANYGKITPQQADQLVSVEIMHAIKRQRQT